MRILRFFHAKRMVLCLGLMGMLAFAGGCGDDPNATVAPKIEPDPIHQITKENFKANRLGTTPEAMKSKAEQKK